MVYYKGTRSAAQKLMNNLFWMFEVPSASADSPDLFYFQSLKVKINVLNANIINKTDHDRHTKIY